MNEKEFPKGHYSPEKGWIAHTWYLVDVSYQYGNPIHTNLLYTGFLNKDGTPGSYSGLIPTNFISDEHSGYGQPRYLKFKRVLLSEKEARE